MALYKVEINGRVYFWGEGIIRKINEILDKEYPYKYPNEQECETSEREDIEDILENKHQQFMMGRFHSMKRNYKQPIIVTNINKPRNNLK